MSRNRYEVWLNLEGMYSGHVWGLHDYLKHKCSHVLGVTTLEGKTLVIMDTIAVAMRLEDYVRDWRKEMLPEEPTLAFELIRGSPDTLNVTTTSKGGFRTL